jgi:predicted lipoprotein with Yx(FWY)xxD motif
MVAPNAQFGSILTDSNGMTLYVFTNDQVGNSTCYGNCATVWPPLISADGNVDVGGQLAGELSVITRADGTMQVAFNGMPLYYYNMDKQPGDTNGQGIAGVWFVAEPNMTGFPAPMQAMPVENNATMNNASTMMNGSAPSIPFVNGTMMNGTNMPPSLYGAAPTPILQVYQSPTLGPILTDSSGMPLYIYSADQFSMFSCSATCATLWPPLIVTSNYTINVPGLSGNVSELMRPDGRYQVTYNGMLLYTYSNDMQPDVPLGNGLNSQWFVAQENMTGYPQAQQGSGGGY